MGYKHCLVVVLLLITAGCAQKLLSPVAIQVPERRINYLDEVKPILDKRCVVCHSCYNSPCQLKISSFEGLDRGATKKKVYDAQRLQTIEPTRLFMDGKSTSQWRYKGFFSVTTSDSGCGTNNSIMMQLLAAKKKTAISDGDIFEAEDKNLTCAETESELGNFLEKHPNRGMPFGFPPLSEEEFQLVGGWLAQGARGPEGEQRRLLSRIPSADQAMIDKWEAYLNDDDPKHILTARYLYEHLFLAHIRFGTGSGTYYELVRSTTAPGEQVDVIATELPYDHPGREVFFYRFRKLHGTIVHKTHMVYTMDDNKLVRVQKLFTDTKWLEEPVKKATYDSSSGNPFVVFQQIPPRSRYLFLLDDIHYIIMTFIRGPVCKGQVALNVVRDHFWLLFLDPEYDLSIRHPGFITTYSHLLEMPLVEEGDYDLARTLFAREYRKKSSAFAAVRQQFYDSYYRYNEVGTEAIWKGSPAADAPLLTVFRHFDSASVHEGPLGYLPQTIWVMDYPLVERIYYALVAGFNVYGSAMHQMSIRVYMDELRQEGETYFLDFMPRDKRREMMQAWYGGMDLDKTRLRYTSSSLEAAYPFRTDDPKREFVESLVDTHFIEEANIQFDRNYLRAGEVYPEIPDTFQDFDDYVAGFQAVSKPGTSFFSTVDDHNANLAYVRIKVNDNETEDVYLSMVINRWHDDVTTMFGEGLRLRPENDRAVFIKNFVGSYPNYFFEVELGEVKDFLKMLRDFTGCRRSMEQLNRYGINRANPRFWEVYDRFQARFNEHQELYPGLFDLNRYFHLALVPESGRN